MIDSWSVHSSDESPVGFPFDEKGFAAKIRIDGQYHNPGLSW
jgi:hypothetical protein